MTRAQMRAFARRLLGEQVAAESVWVDADLEDYLQQGLDQTVGDGELLQGTTQRDSEASVGEYPFAPDTLRPLRVFYQKADGTVPGEELLKTSIPVLDAERPGWPNFTPGRPDSWAVRGRLLVLVPAPVDDLKRITIWDVRAHPTLAENDEPLIPASFHRASVFKACAFACEQDRYNPAAKASIPVFERWYQEAFASAMMLSNHTQMPGRVVDIRDRYLPESGWRE